MQKTSKLGRSGTNGLNLYQPYFRRWHDFIPNTNLDCSISSLSRVKKAATLRKTLESVFLIISQVSRRITYERFLKVISFQNEISEPKIYWSSEIVFESNMGVGGVLSLLWFQKRLPDYAAKKRLKLEIMFLYMKFTMSFLYLKFKSINSFWKCV